MLEDPELAPRPDDPEQLSERSIGIGHGAEHQRGDGGVVEWEVLGEPAKDLHWDGCALRPSTGQPAEVRLGLHGRDPLNLRRVVGEVDAVAGTDFDHRPPGGQPAVAGDTRRRWARRNPST